jgi:hypothetical protein
MKAEVRERLLQGGVDRFVELLIEDTLATPVRDLADPAELSQTVVAALRGAATDPTVERLLIERVKDLRRIGGTGPLPFPHELHAPLSSLIGRSFVPDRALLGEILDHRASRVLLKGLLEDVTIAFAARMRPPMSVPPLKGFGALGGRLGGVAQSVSNELQHTVEAKAKEFVHAAVDRLVGKLADQLCDRQDAQVYAEWRVHALNTIMRADRKVLIGEVEKLDPEDLARSALQLVRAIVARESFPGELERTLRLVIDESGARTVGELLGGVEHHALGVLRELLRARARAVVQTEAFASWWDEMNGE